MKYVKKMIIVHVIKLISVSIMYKEKQYYFRFLEDNCKKMMI